MSLENKNNELYSFKLSIKREVEVLLIVFCEILESKVEGKVQIEITE
jgi:hypothetical protein